MSMEYKRWSFTPNVSPGGDLVLQWSCIQSGRNRISSSESGRRVFTKRSALGDCDLDRHGVSCCLPTPSIEQPPSCHTNALPQPITFIDSRSRFVPKLKDTYLQRLAEAGPSHSYFANLDPLPALESVIELGGLPVKRQKLVNARHRSNERGAERGIANIPVAVTEKAHRRGWIVYSPLLFSGSRCLALSKTKLRDYAQVSRSGSYAYRKTLPLQSSPIHNETARLHPGHSFRKLCVPQNTASTIIPCSQRNCKTTPRPLVQEAMRTAKHCLYNHPLFTTKLQDYTQATRSRSYSYRKTLPLQSSPVHNETARLHPGHSFKKLCVPQNTASTIIPCSQRNCKTTPRPLVQEAMRTAKHCLYNHPVSTTKLRDYTQAIRSKSYAYRKTLPLESSPIHNETGRLQLCLSFKNLYGPQKTAIQSSPLRMRTLYTSQVACSGTNNPQKLQRLLRIKSKAEIKISEKKTHFKVTYQVRISSFFKDSPKYIMEINC
ncbi:hypothetical protein J6590_072646 [Homalodisca vitripennis]|nr:hypothetical protein J6590_093543 [Homalodisca vitripennis]KAG8335250.1 hypothetical protein J6590_072646 [Homalodisca vitripennis]